MGLLACSSPANVTSASLTLRYLPGCPLGDARTLSTFATGDFPEQEDELDPAGGVQRHADYPVNTRVLRVEAGYPSTRAGGMVAMRAASFAQDVLVLPVNQSCQAEGGPAQVSGGATATANGGLLLAGGLSADDATASDEVRYMAPGAQGPLATATLALPRALLASVEGPDGVLIMGGMDPGDGIVHPDFERIDVAGETPQRMGGGDLAGPRFAAGAGTLPDGSVLLVGGRAGMAEPPLASAERIDPGADAARLLEAQLQAARLAPDVLVLDDGSVLIVGGRDGSNAWINSVERYDPESDVFMPSQAILPPFLRAAAVALPGARVAIAGCGQPNEEDCGLVLLLPDEEDWAAQALLLDLASAGVESLDALSLAAVSDGRLLLSGRHQPSGESRAFLVDVSRNAIRSAPLTGMPHGLRSLVDGSLAELAAQGVSLQRHNLTGPFDDPEGGLLAPASLGVTLDHPARWEFREPGLATHSAPARFDVPHLRFADVRIELVLAGTGQLLFTREGRAPLALTIDDDSLSLEDCGFVRGEGAIVIVRQGGTLTVDASGTEVSCPMQELGEHVGIGLRLDTDSAVTSFTLRRL